MRDVADFVERVYEQFSNSQQGVPSRYSLGLSRSAIEELVKATFFASMISDEGRFPIVSLMTYRKDSDHKVHLPFTTPVPVSAQEIAKLSHAAGDSNHLRLFTDNGRVFIGALESWRVLGRCGEKWLVARGSVGNGVRNRESRPRSSRLATCCQNGG